ncbi:DNA/RNA helicase domain-containing protein [uncultured Helicobacter sp.]|uniref:DNA/RNA helicase domain-containing protein n=1 Tax=uncultured Helicobacter sp. TaxID=175537 RepID=UPI0037503FDA
MLKKVNLLNIANIINLELVNDNPEVKKYTGLEGTKDNEQKDLCLLYDMILSLEKDYHCVENFYLNYKIPQINKEFDLLRIGKTSIVNIELKSKNIDEERILKQLQRNYYYLSFLDRKIYCFTFIAEDKSVYQYDNNELLKVDIAEIVKALKEVQDDIAYPNDLFVPSNYLISPLNNTKSFLENKYFLTSHQEKIEKEILKQLECNPYSICSIAGSAGTGKTLLIYHLAKTLKEKGVMIVHCASSNGGIETLKENGWKISTIKDFNYDIKPEIDIIIFDEVHRVRLSELKEFVEKAKNQKCIIFSHDVKQKLNPHNKAEEVVEYVESIADYKTKLGKKIRYNQEIVSFITKLFNLQKIKTDNSYQGDYHNISLRYMADTNQAKEYIKHLVEKKGYEHIYLTTSMYYKEKLDDVRFDSNISSHKSIGQEFDKVLVTITEDFYHTEDGRLGYRSRSYYSATQTLFQAITRTRKELMVVIINNPEVYKNCVQILYEN